jgi:hypothetical protein
VDFFHFVRAKLQLSNRFKRDLQVVLEFIDVEGIHEANWQIEALESVGET